MQNPQKITLGNGIYGMTDYEVDVSVTPWVVSTVKKRKTLGYGYSYARGEDTYLSRLKPHSANWQKVVRAITDRYVAAQIERDRLECVE